METIDFDQAIPFIKAFCHKLTPEERKELFSIVLSSFNTCDEVREACKHHFKWDSDVVWLLSVDYRGMMKGFLASLTELDIHVHGENGENSVVAERIRRLEQNTYDIVSHLERQRNKNEPDCTSR